MAFKVSLALIKWVLFNVFVFSSSLSPLSWLVPTLVFFRLPIQLAQWRIHPL